MYLYRACIVKNIYGDDLKIEDPENPDNKVYPPGYSPSCSIMTDMLVLFFFVAKILMSQITNGHDVDDILLNDDEYIDLVRYADYFLQ